MFSKTEISIEKKINKQNDLNDIINLDSDEETDCQENNNADYKDSDCCITGVIEVQEKCINDPRSKNNDEINDSKNKFFFNKENIENNFNINDFDFNESEDESLAVLDEIITNSKFTRALTSNSKNVNDFSTDLDKDQFSSNRKNSSSDESDCEIIDPNVRDTKLNQNNSEKTVVEIPEEQKYHYVSTKKGHNGVTVEIKIPKIEYYERNEWIFNEIKDCSAHYHELNYPHSEKMFSAFSNYFGLKSFRPQPFGAINAALNGNRLKFLFRYI